MKVAIFYNKFDIFKWKYFYYKRSLVSDVTALDLPQPSKLILLALVFLLKQPGVKLTPVIVTCLGGC